MQQLKQLNKIVKEVLEENPETRRSDIKLIMEVFKRRGVNTSESFATLAVNGQLAQMESITRARRKVQSDYPELKDDHTAELRAEREEVFREYAKTPV